MKKTIIIDEKKMKRVLSRIERNPSWIAGFVAGEGCFTADFNKQLKWRFPYQIIPSFIVVQHVRDIEVLYRLKEYFNCGQVSKNKGLNDTTSDIWQWRVRDTTK
jgi:hypothetical protein